MWGSSQSGVGTLGGSNINVGVKGVSNSNIGVQGVSTSSSGVEGRSGSSDGVYGVSDDGIGVNGYGGGAAGIGIKGVGKTGIYAQSTDPNGYAIDAAGPKSGSFSGNVDIYGDLFVLHKIINPNKSTFKMDHPLDPANKYLSHSAVESPELKNVYDGNALTDANGWAKVRLPVYFESFNKDFRYQLTVIGDFAQAVVSKEIENNSFEIKTDKPNVKVSWQVTGTRNDAYAKAHPIEVEKAKAEKDRGKYLAPEAFGQPKEMGIYYRPETEDAVAKEPSAK